MIVHHSEDLEWMAPNIASKKEPRKYNITNITCKMTNGVPWITNSVATNAVLSMILQSDAVIKKYVLHNPNNYNWIKNHFELKDRIE